MNQPRPAQRARLSVELLEDRLAPATSLFTFDNQATGTTPAGWSQWASDPATPFAVSSAASYSPANGLSALASRSSLAARAWVAEQQPADVEVSAAVQLKTNQLTPAQVFARGQNLDAASPTYYAVQVVRGLKLQLVKVVNGTSTVPSGGSVTSTRWTENLWVRPTLRVSGDRIQAQLQRLDNGQYLSSTGVWQTGATWALDLIDASPISAAGKVGVGRGSPGYVERLTFDDVSVTPLQPTDRTERFDSTASGLPAGWAQWTSNANTTFSVSTSQALSGAKGLNLPAGASNLEARAWQTTPQPADIAASAAVFAGTIVPTQVFARGRNLDRGSGDANAALRPSYYAVEASAGGVISLVKVVNGVSTTLKTINTPSYLQPEWLYLTIQAEGDRILAQVYRPATGEYLVPFEGTKGYWQQKPGWAISVTDGSITGGGFSGVGRLSNRGSVPLSVDDFSAVPARGDGKPADRQAPQNVTLSILASGPVSGPVTLRAAGLDDVGIARVDFFVDDTYKAQLHTPVPYSPGQPFDWVFDTSTLPDGPHTFKVRVFDRSGNSAESSPITVTTQNGRAAIVRHAEHIRIAQVGYGTPQDAAFQSQLRDTVDMVILEDDGVLDGVQGIAPNTPAMFYTNVSNVYRDSLIDWLNHADAHGHSREEAFYHVSKDTPFAGNSASARPVRWFWKGYTYSAATKTYTNITAKIAATSVQPVAFSNTVGDAVVVGYPDPFAAVNVTLFTAAAGNWAAAYEYSTGVDAAGQPTWAALPTGAYAGHGNIQYLLDSTGGLRRNGAIRFIPPANWKPVPAPGSPGQSYYMVRLRTTRGGTPPRTATLFADDYVKANGGATGTVPAFDARADLDGNRYIDDYEYGPASRDPQKSARFAYQGRAIANTYGQMRFATNPASAAFRAWAVDYNKRLAADHPGIEGLFVDNSWGEPVLATGVVVNESTANYGQNYAGLLSALDEALGSLSLMPNTAGRGDVTPIAGAARAYFEEFSIRATAHGARQFENLAARVAERAAMPNAPWHGILDSLSAASGKASPGTRTDPRVLEATLAYYYLIADPHTNLLDLFGGESTFTSWSEHYTNMVKFNVGRPQEAFSLFASGRDPSNGNYLFNVYQRGYQRLNADGTRTDVLALYKPLSAQGETLTTKIDDTTGTLHQLSGTYRRLLSDGVTLSEPMTSIRLKNGEGAILVRVS